MIGQIDRKLIGQDNMGKNRFLKITEILYNISDFLDDEILQKRIKDIGLNIFSNLILLYSENPKLTSKEKFEKSLMVEKDIEILVNLLKLIRKRNNFTSFNNLNFLILEKEYKEIKKQMKEFQKVKSDPEEDKKDKEVKKNNNQNFLTKRQKEIVDILKREKQVQVSHLLNFFPNLNKRTLRRDLKFLVDKGIIKRAGSFNKIHYYLS